MPLRVDGGDPRQNGRSSARRRIVAGKQSLLEYCDLLAARQVEPSARDSVRRRLFLLADVVALLTGFALTRFAFPIVHHGGFDYQVFAALPPWVLLNKLIGLYDHDAPVIDKSSIHELPAIAQSLAIGGGLLFLLAPVMGLEVHRREALEFFAVTGLSMVVLRWAVRRAVLARYGPERTIIVGSGAVAKLFARKLRDHREYGIEVVGCIDVGDGAGSGNGNRDGELSMLGDLSRFAEICHKFGVERVLVAFSQMTHEELLNAVRASKLLGVKLAVVPRLFEVVGRSAVLDEVEGLTVLSLGGLSRTRSSLALKRAIDIVGAGAGLLLLAPLMIAIAIAVKLTSRGPVLFVQRRIGRGDQPFRMYKFRTMLEGADRLKAELAHLNEAEHPMFKITEDPRVTRVGRFLRKTSLDELPQLWNVLRGEMSLVGPRPLVPSEDAHVIGWHRARLELTPGLSGPWQVFGRNSIPFDEMVKLDYLYVADWSLWNDIKLLLLTGPAMLRRQGC